MHLPLGGMGLGQCFSGRLGRKVCCQAEPVQTDADKCRRRQEVQLASRKHNLQNTSAENKRYSKHLSAETTAQRPAWVVQRMSASICISQTFCAVPDRNLIFHRLPLVLRLAQTTSTVNGVSSCKQVHELPRPSFRQRTRPHQAPVRTRQMSPLA